MLSLKAFKAQHAKKFAGMTNAEILKRYQDYSSTNKNVKVRTKPVIREREVIVRDKAPRYVNQNMVHISKCTQHYLKALVNPFGSFSELPCVPDIISLPSHKIMCRTRGTFSIGSLGTGFVACKPKVPVNDQNCIEYTTPTFVLGSYQPPPAVGVATASNNSTFNTAQFNASVPPLQYRLVGAGLRVSYIGSEFNRGGLVILYRSPANVFIPGGSTSANLLQNSSASQAPSIRTWESVSWRPDEALDLSYQAYNPLAQPSTMLILVEGGVPGTVYNYEFVQFFEVLGSVGNNTASHSDITGMGAALASFPVAVSTKTPLQQEKIALRNTAKGIADSSSVVMPVLKQIGSGLKMGIDALNLNIPGLVMDVAGMIADKGTSQSVYALTAPKRTEPIVTDVDFDD